MRVIRSSCFETNSSSQHSLVVTTNDTHVTQEEFSGDGLEHIWLAPDGGMHLYDVQHGYGRSPFKLLTTFQDKLEYAMCEFLGYKYADDPEYQEIYNEFESLVCEIVPRFTHFDIGTEELDIYRDQDGNEILHKDLIYNGWDKDERRCNYLYKDKNGNKHDAIYDEDNYIESPSIGVIDHQSAGVLKSFLKDRNVSLREFLTNKRYMIVVDGDEYCVWDVILSTGLIDKDKIVEQYYDSDEKMAYYKMLEEEE